jgi:hypothetical protein
MARNGSETLRYRRCVIFDVASAKIKCVPIDRRQKFAKFFAFPKSRLPLEPLDMGVKRRSDFILTLEDDDIASQSESDSEPDQTSANAKTKSKKRKIVDDDLNPEFEFDGYGVLGGVKGIDDDGWGFSGIPGMKASAGVDLESIIARRREKNEDGTDESDVSDDDDDDDEDEEAEEEVDGEEDDEEFTGIHDDIGKSSIPK